MTDQKKKLELEKTRTLLLASLDYCGKRVIGSMVFDQWDPAEYHYSQEKKRSEEDYRDFKLDALQHRLSKLVRGLQDRIDLNFESFIKEETGYDIDIFSELREDVAGIVLRGKIENRREFRSVDSLIQVYRSKSLEKESIDKLIKLIDEFTKCNPSDRQTREAESPEVKYTIAQIKVAPTDSEFTAIAHEDNTTLKLSESEFAEFQRTKGVISESCSPDNKRGILIQTNGVGKSAFTGVAIWLKGGSGSIYYVKGSNLPIKAFWKNNSTVVIETKKSYEIEIKHNTVSSFDDVVRIEYIED